MRMSMLMSMSISISLTWEVLLSGRSKNTNTRFDVGVGDEFVPCPGLHLSQQPTQTPTSQRLPLAGKRLARGLRDDTRQASRNVDASAVFENMVLVPVRVVPNDFL